MAAKYAECGYTDLDLDVSAGVVEGCPREMISEMADRWLKRFRALLELGPCVSCDGRLANLILVVGNNETLD